VTLEQKKATIMAVHIKLIKNNIKSSSSYGKYFAKTVSQGEISFRQITEEACRNSHLSEGTVIAVVTELEDLLKEKLSDGHTVVLPGIGRFSLRVESTGVDEPRQFNIKQHITFSTTSATVCKPYGRRGLSPRAVETGFRTYSFLIFPDVT